MSDASPKNPIDAADTEANTATETAEPSQAEPERNPPLNFPGLKNLDPTHPYLVEQELSQETIAHFGIGFCKTGMMKGRIAISIHDEDAVLIGYTGRYPGAPPKGELVYLFPPGFSQSSSTTSTALASTPTKGSSSAKICSHSLPSGSTAGATSSQPWARPCPPRKSACLSKPLAIAARCFSVTSPSSPSPPPTTPFSASPPRSSSARPSCTSNPHRPCHIPAPRLARGVLYIWYSEPTYASRRS